MWFAEVEVDCRNKGSGAGGSMCQLLGSMILSKYFINTAFFRDVFQCLQKVMSMKRVQGNLNPLGQTHRLVRSWDYFVGVMWN